MDERSQIWPIKSPPDAESGSEGPSAELFTRLRRDILNGTLRPGEKLPVEGLQKRYGGGAGALRDALARLAAEQLVVSSGKRGVAVAPISLTDLADILRMRQFVESAALRASIERGDEAWEAQVVAAFHALSKLDWAGENGGYAEEWEARHSRFHRALIEACGSPWLLRLSALFYDLNARYRHLTLVRLKITPRDHLREHRDIMEAALARDGEAAGGLIAAHMSKTAVLLLERGMSLLSPGKVGTGQEGGLTETEARRFLLGELERAGLQPPSEPPA